MTTPDSPTTLHSPHLPAQLAGPLGDHLKGLVLPQWLPQRRWFRSKTQSIQVVDLEAVFPCQTLGVLGADAVFTVLRVTFSTGAVERYLLPLGLLAPGDTSDLPEAALLGPVETPAGARLLIDACWHAGFRTWLLEVLAGHHEALGSGGALRGYPAFGQTFSGTPLAASRVLNAEQSNTALVYGQGPEALFVKLYRRLEAGIHAEPEMLRFLSEQTTFRHAPQFISSLEWIDPLGQTYTTVLAAEFLADATDMWSYVLDGLRAKPQGDDIAGLPAALHATAALIGRRVGEFHRAAASHTDGAAFAPEPFTMADAISARARARASLAEGVRDVQALLATPPLHFEHEAHALLDGQARLFERIEAAVHAVGHGSTGFKIRTHGDLHLGQILIHTGSATPEIRILDFEGEPGRPLAAAREKQSPLRDVAGMLRSFHYAAHASVLLSENHHEQVPSHAQPDARAAALCASFLDEYFTVLDRVENLEGGGILPDTTEARRALLDLFVLEKATYELQYECNNRPSWMVIPLRGLLALCEPKT